jgi:Na+/H+ antiporter NhaC
MTRNLSVLLGGLVGLGLAAVLLVPSADREALVAQTMGSLLSAHAEEAGSPESPTIFSALDQLAADSTLDLGLEQVLLDGQASDAPGFRRAFGSRLNEYNQAHRPELPPLRLVAEGQAAELSLMLLITTDGDAVQLAAAVSRGAERIAVSSASTDAALTTAAMPGRMALLPPLIAILVALVLRKTLLALFMGILTGAVMLAHTGGVGWGAATVSGFLDVFRVFFMHELVDTFRVELIGFVIALVAMVGVMSRSGGVAGLVQLLVGFAKTVRSTLFVTWGMGLLIFFDDYANCLLVGNTMRPLTDRLRISREKLAYIVDSTAAPIAGISLLSTWIAYEVSTYSAHLPAAGITVDAYEVFLRTIPYRYYCLFTLAFVGLSIFLRRDFGPMLAAERRARETGQLVRAGGKPMVSDEATSIQPKAGMPRRWIDAALPILLVLLGTILVIFIEGGGMQVLRENSASLLTLQGIDGVKGITQILFDGSGGRPIFLGATFGLMLAIFLAGSNMLRCAVAAGVISGWFCADWAREQLIGLEWVANKADGGVVLGMADYLAYVLAFLGGALAVAALLRALAGQALTTSRPFLPGPDIRRSAFSSVRALFFAVLILFQAWMIGEVCKRMGTADYLVALLSGSVTATMLPVLLFVAACIVAFATGSSWSTMAILLPNVVALAASVGDAAGMGALTMVVICVGAVLEGSIFGDHCSPISDTTVLSSVASASDHVDHVRTQAPYALVTAAIAICVGYLPTVAFEAWTPPIALGAGVAVIVIVLLVVGKRTPEGVLDDEHDASDSAAGLAAGSAGAAGH